MSLVPQNSVKRKATTVPGGLLSQWSRGDGVQRKKRVNEEFDQVAPQGSILNLCFANCTAQHQSSTRLSYTMMWFKQVKAAPALEKRNKETETELQKLVARRSGGGLQGHKSQQDQSYLC